MMDSILLVDDENLFHLVFEDACNILDISLSLHAIKSTDDAEKYFKNIVDKRKRKPDCIFVDLNMVGSTFDGIELVRRINFIHGNNVVIGIISSSDDSDEQARAVKAGAQFWMVKTDDIEPRLLRFKNDFLKFKDRTSSFVVYN